MQIPDCRVPSGYEDRSQDVSLWRWFEYHFGCWIERRGNCIMSLGRRIASCGSRTQWHAMDPDDNVPF